MQIKYEAHVTQRINRRKFGTNSVATPSHAEDIMADVVTKHQFATAQKSGDKASTIKSRDKRNKNLKSRTRQLNFVHLL